MKIIEINTGDGVVAAPEWLEKSERVLRQLRPALPADYATKMKRVFAQGGRMCVAVDQHEVRGVAVYRVYENTSSGMHMYVDDLVTDETSRSQGVGKALLDHMQEMARQKNCDNFKLDSGTQRQQAHKFYFREGMCVHAFHFIKPLRQKS
jgi:GNAT superfamily N-acetyltransferase